MDARVERRRARARARRLVRRRRAVFAAAVLKLPEKNPATVIPPHRPPTRSAISERLDIPPGTSIDLLRVLLRLWERKRVILLATVATGLAAVAVTTLLPDRYKGRASVLGSRQSGMMENATSQLVNDYLPIAVFGKSIANESLDNSLAILDSRTAMETVVRTFDLVRVYGVRDGSMERAIEILRRHTIVDLERNDNIAVTVYDTDPVRAAGMANTFVRVLNDVTRDASGRQARNTREFLERRYARADSAMRTIEDALRAYQSKHGIYSLPQQTRTAIDEAARLQAEAAITDVEIGVLERAFGEGAPQASARRTAREALRAQLDRMRRGAENRDSATVSMLSPFADAPAVGMGFERLAREYRAQARILEQIARLLEKARLDEQRSTMSVVVLDRAVPAERRDSPKRVLIGIAFALSGMLISCAVVLRRDARRSA